MLQVIEESNGMRAESVRRYHFRFLCDEQIELNTINNSVRVMGGGARASNNHPVRERECMNIETST